MDGVCGVGRDDAARVLAESVEEEREEMGELVAAKLQVAELLTENEGLKRGIAPPADTDASGGGAFARLARRVSTRS